MRFIVSLSLGIALLVATAVADETDVELLEFLGAESGADEDWYEFIEMALDGWPVDGQDNATTVANETGANESPDGERDD